MKIGANYLGAGNCEFTVWAPTLNSIELKIVHPFEGIYPLSKDDHGYWRMKLEGIQPGSQYFYRIHDLVDRPDPASKFQPFGVHGPSQVIDHKSFQWSDYKWGSLHVSSLIIYEIHVGTFTKEGTYTAAIQKLNHLAELGVTAIEIMPISQFPGSRNWGYDGVSPYSPQNSYGTPDELKRFINEAHNKNIAVILDVVYNHFGPEGNYLREFGPYFTYKYRTPWGDAVNFDEDYSDGVRNYFIENALSWFSDYHIDGLRVDAIDMIYDNSATHFLRELAQSVDQLNMNGTRSNFIIAESDLNDDIVIRPFELHGYNFDAQWTDDFHHSVHTLLTSETDGYYQDFGTLNHLKKALEEGFVYSGEYSVYRRRKHGNSVAERPPYKFVVCVQNHDQVGNRALGERLASLVSFEALKLAAGILFLSPYIPLLFMGEEYGEISPFLYFVDHEDLNLMENVKKGRLERLRAFNWRDEIPDPTTDHSFHKSKLDWELVGQETNSVLFSFYKHLIEFRKTHPALQNADRKDMEVSIKDEVLYLRRWKGESELLCIFNFNRRPVNTTISTPTSKGRKIIDSSDPSWQGKGSDMPDIIIKEEIVQINELSFSVYEMESLL